jgi:hypothetical protein
LDGGTASDAASEDAGTGESGLQDAAIDAATEDGGTDAVIDGSSIEDGSAGVDSAGSQDSGGPTGNDGGSLAPNGGGSTWATNSDSTSSGCECGLAQPNRTSSVWTALAVAGLCVSLGLRRRRVLPRR